ncbi:MAG: tyrosine-type recombinase/integrase [Bacillota bacterium]
MGKLLKVTARNYQSWQECIDEFLVVKTAEGLSDRTLNDYRWHVGHFFTLHPGSWGDYDHFRKSIFVYFSNSKDLSPATHNIRRKYLKAFFSWCEKEGILTANPVKSIPPRREEPRVRHLDEETLKLLMKTPKLDTFPGLRDYAMLCLALDSGIRPKEMVSLLTEDINLKSMEVRVRAEVAKTRTSRTLPIAPITTEALRRVLAVTPTEWKAKTVFCTCEGNPITTNAWRLVLC